MDEDRVIKVADRLLAKSQAGEIAWQETADEDTFPACFPDYSVRISKYETRGATNYTLTLADSMGRDLKSLLSIGPPSPEVAETLKDLFELARGRALSVDEKIDRILESLQKS